MNTLSDVRLLSDNDGDTISNGRRAPEVDSFKQNIGVVWRTYSITLNRREKIALFLAVFMTLAPLAAAAWGSYFSS